MILLDPVETHFLVRAEISLSIFRITYQANGILVNCDLPSQFLQLVEKPKEDEISVLWKAVEQVYRFGLGSIAGGVLIPLTNLVLLCQFLTE